MRNALAVIIVALIPFSAMAQTQPALSPPLNSDGSGGATTLTVAALVIGGLIAVDWLSAGVLSGPITSATGWSFPWVRGATVVVVP